MTSHGLKLVLAGVLCSFTGAATGTRLAEMLRHEERLNLGKPLPDGIVVSARDGTSVDLREALRGPAIVLVVASDCPPCDELLGYVARQQPQGRMPDGTRLAVLQFGDDVVEAAGIPEQIPVYVSPAPRGKGFFEGEITPAAYFFDSSLVLTGKRLGMAGDGGSMLVPPDQP